MAPGIVLIIIGAIFTFAIRSDGTWIDTRVLGVILMLGGVGFILRSRMKRQEVVTRETESADGTVTADQTRVVERRVE
jgi:predicted membrane channel-forming protein YqfA (hemolysin III family)